MGIILLTLIGWSDVIEKVDMETSHRNGRPFDLVDTEAFDQALTKYIDHLPQDVEDLNFFMIYLKPSNLYPKGY